jgi:orotidine-5'-phosphate decarboxylase
LPSSSFGARLHTAFEKYGQLCVGVDPHSALMLEWGLPDNVRGLDAFSKTVVDAAAGRVGIIKPQVAFFERFGSKGFAILEKLGERASESGLLVIMDAKRGDIGSTMEGYFDAWLGKDAPFHADALTVSPYLGFDSLKSFMAGSVERGKGLFVLDATSNPEAQTLQTAQIPGVEVTQLDQDGNPFTVTTEPTTLAAAIWSGLESVNTITAGPTDLLGSFGAVLGATLNLNRFGLSNVTTIAQTIATPILAPGFGAQGARLADAGRLFGSASHQVIASVSRSVLSAGAAGIEDAIDAAKAELAEGLA